jgi:hypothetical protein
MLPFTKEVVSLPTRLADGGSFQLDRYFEVWQYYFGLRRFVIRTCPVPTPSGPDPATVGLRRIDILFANTAHIDMPTRLHITRIVDVTEYSAEELKGIENGVPYNPYNNRECRTYAIHSPSGIWRIVTGACHLSEDDLDGNEPGAFDW